MTENVTEDVLQDAAPGPGDEERTDKDDPEASTVDSGGGPTDKDVPAAGEG